jgi:class 3 adenylate cyclase/tetratricopeptide (TPR) repeat protein
MKCSRCQHENRADAKFCEECAAPLPRTCRRCGGQLSPAAKFCPECALPTGLAATVAAAPRVASPASHTSTHPAEPIVTSTAALEGERKQVTVLFADLKGSMELLADRDPEEARRILDPVLERMMEAVHRYEGTVNQVMGDGIMALFGAPLAHEEHAVRACYAALRMQESVKAYAEDVRRTSGIPPAIRVGINSGEVVARSVGSDIRMDYTAVGQTTHLAARMEQAALPGTIVITADTLRLAEGYIHVTPLGRMSVKGLTVPVEAYEVTGAGPVRTRLQAAAARGFSRFVGRDPELGQLHEALERARDGHGQVVAIVGEAGVGKSRLLHEFTRSHRVHGWLVLESESVFYGRTTASLPVIELLKAYFDVEAAHEARRIREKITGKLLSLDRQLEPSLPALLSLMDVPVKDAAWQSLDPGERRQRMLNGIKALLLRESQVQPVLMIFEDLHWIDSETQALLDSLVESLPAARILLLVNYRPEYEHGWLKKTYYSQLRLDPLPAERAAEFLEALLGADPGLEPLKRLLIDRTDGNPFFLEESVRTLIETNTLVRERGAYRITRAVERIQVPATVQAVIATRIDRLAPETKRLLQCAAVIGHDVPLTLLQAVSEETTEAVRRVLAGLQAGEFLYETRLFPEPEYRFRHALTLEVTYQNMLRDQRRALHERALRTLETSVGREGGEPIELLAHHAVRAEVWDRAAQHLYRSGERAYAQARYHASADFYRTTLEVLDRLGAAADLTLKLDACLELWSAQVPFGQWDGLRELGENAAALARALGDGTRLAQVQLRQAQAVSFNGMISGTLESALEQAREAFQRADPHDLRTRSYAQFIVGQACRDLGRMAEAVQEFGAGIALFEEANRQGTEPGLVLPIYVSLSAWRSEAYAALGHFEHALMSGRDALRAAMETQHPASLLVAQDHLGYAHLLHGDLHAAVPLLERALAVATEHDLLHGLIRASSRLAYVLALLGEGARGLGLLDKVLGRYTARATPPVRAYGTTTASAYLAAGAYEDARAEIQQGLAAAAERHARGHLATLQRLAAEVLEHDDDFAEARACLEEALAIAAEQEMRSEVARCHLALGRLSLRSGRCQEARTHLTMATAMYRAMGMTYWVEKAEAAMTDLT